MKWGGKSFEPVTPQYWVNGRYISGPDEFAIALITHYWCIYKSRTIN